MRRRDEGTLRRNEGTCPNTEEGKDNSNTTEEGNVTWEPTGVLLMYVTLLFFIFLT